MTPPEATAQVQDWLNAFSQQVDTVPLVPNEFGVMGINYGALEIVVEVDDAQCLHLHTRLLDVPSADTLAFYQRLLRLNAFCLATGGATLALDPDESVVLLCAQQALALMDDVSFTPWLTNFAQHAETLCELLSANGSIPNALVRV